MLSKLRTDTAHHIICSLNTFPQQLLLFLYLQLLGQLKHDAVNQLVVCQLVLRTDPDSAEDLIM